MMGKQMVAKLERRRLVDEKVIILMALAVVMKRGNEMVLVVVTGVVAVVVMGEGVVGAVGVGVVGAVGVAVAVGAATAALAVLQS